MIKDNPQMVFLLPENKPFFTAEFIKSLGTLQPSNDKGLSLKCPISVERGDIRGKGNIDRAMGNCDLFEHNRSPISYLLEYRLKLITPQRELPFSYVKLDRALSLDSGTFFKTQYSKSSHDVESSKVLWLVQQYLTSQSLQRIHLDKYIIAFNMLIANLVQARTSKKMLLISRHKETVLHQNPFNIDNRFIAKICDWLSSENYIEMLIQPNQIPNNDKTAQSSIFPTEKLFYIFYAFRIIQAGDSLELRGSDKIPLKFPNKKGTQLKLKKYSKVLHDYHNLIADYLFTLNERDFPAFGTRVFNRTIDLGGRYYANYQSTPSNDRKRIKINHKKTIELDYKSLHFNLLYCMANIQLKGDPYLVDGFDRTTIKVISFQLLNTEGEKGLSELARMITLSGTEKQIKAVTDYDVKRGIYERLVKRNLRIDPPNKPKNVKYHIDCVPVGTDGKKLIKALRERHQVISEFIGSKDIGLKLQNMDSNIMKDVMSEATARKIPLLFIHDSCICDYEQRNEIKEIMIKAFNDKTGFNIKVTQPKKKVSLK